MKHKNNSQGKWQNTVISFSKQLMANSCLALRMATDLQFPKRQSFTGSLLLKAQIAAVAIRQIARSKYKERQGITFLHSREPFIGFKGKVSL